MARLTMDAKPVGRTAAVKSARLAALAAGLALAAAPGAAGARSDYVDLDPDWVKAMIRVETGFSQENYETDPMQVNKLGEWEEAKSRVGLEKGVAPGPNLSLMAGLVRLRFEVYQIDASGRRVRFRGWEEATRRYNGGGDPNYLATVKKAYQDIKDGR